MIRHSSIKISAIIISCIFFLATSSAYTAENESSDCPVVKQQQKVESVHESMITEDDSAPKAYNFWNEFTNMVITLALILGTLIVFAWILKRFLSKRVIQVNATSSIRIIERRALSPKTAIYLLDVLGKGIIIGESPAGLNALGELPLETNLNNTRDSKHPNQALFRKCMNEAQKKETEK